MILPTAYPFTKFVRVYSMVFSFISKCIKGREILSRLLAEGRIVFRMFNVNLEDDNPNHNTASAGKFSLGGEVGGIRSDPPNLTILDLTEDEPAMG